MTKQKVKHGECAGGQRGSSEYWIWINMRQRCENPNNNGYKWYGARGIAVCARWESYDNFITDMGRRPTPAHSIERKDNDGGYSPDNCVWATVKEQMDNRSNSLRVDGMTIREIAESSGMKYAGVYARLHRGWSPDQIINAPKGNNGIRSTSVIIEADGERLSMNQWAKRLGVYVSVIHARLKRGMPPDEAVRFKRIDKRGEASHSAKLTSEIVNYILRSDKTALELSEEFEVSRTLIYQIRAGNIWQHIKRK